VDRELTRAELDELLPLFAADALDGEERAQVARYVERDAEARAEVESLREALSYLPAVAAPAPASLWEGIASSLDAPSDLEAPPLRIVSGDALSTPTQPSRGSRGRRAVALLAAAAIVLAVVLGVQVVRQQDRIDDLAAEMHQDPMKQQAMAARGADDAHVIALDAMTGGAGGAGGEVVMLPDGTGYLMGHELPALDGDRTYQLWAEVGRGDDARMVSLGVLGRSPGISAFRLTAAPTMFEVTREPASGSTAPGSAVVLRGEVA
jgi:anti-sigma-K factor RskA